MSSGDAERAGGAMTSAIERAVAAVGPEPYYEHAGVTIYHGDCRDVLPLLCGDVVLTDPPYNTQAIGANRKQYVGGPGWARTINFGLIRSQLLPVCPSIS